MPILKVTKTRNRYAFDVIEGKPLFQDRHSATGVQVICHGIVGNGRIRTYANVVGHCTIRHKHEISENIIDRFQFGDNLRLQASLRIHENGTHIYTIEENHSNN